MTSGMFPNPLYFMCKIFWVCTYYGTKCLPVVYRSLPGCSLAPTRSLFDYQYIQDGDITIGAVFNVHYLFHSAKSSHIPPTVMCNLVYPQYYRHLLAFIFAVDEINRNPDLLPNVTLGYQAYDSCSNVNKVIENVLQILSGPKRTVPNFSCVKGSQVVALIGDLSSAISQSVATLMGVFGYTKFNFGAADIMVRGRMMYTFPFRIDDNDANQYKAISDLLLQFDWNWIGIIASDDDSGEKESQGLIKEITKHKICVEFVYLLKEEGIQQASYSQDFKTLQISTAPVAVICGSVSVLFLVSEDGKSLLYNKTLIFTSWWTFQMDLENLPVVTVNGSLAFTVPERRIPALQYFLENINPLNRPTDMLLEEIWAQFFSCVTSDAEKNFIFENVYKCPLHNCTGSEQIVNISNVVYDTVNFRTSYHVYTAVYIIAHALHNFLAESSDHLSSLKRFRKQLNYYIRNIHFKDSAGEDICYNERGSLPVKYNIVNRVVLANGHFLMRTVGSFNTLEPEGRQLDINKTNIIWKNGWNQAPSSRCSEQCLPGYRRTLQKGKHLCCYDCVPCTEGEISIQKDSDNCQICQENQWPNEDRTVCLLKSLEFLSYETDVIAAVISFFSIFSTVLTSVVLGIFVSFRDTPIVKANNQNLSFLLLVAIMLSFLCVLLFLGRPVDITCMLRQTSFGVLFSVAVSSVLAKTIMVYIAFKATKPGNLWRKYFGSKLSCFVVVFCSLIQVALALIWLIVSPPYQEVNKFSYPGKILFKCNEGSLLAFYCLIGYTGFLASVSFIVAFLARNLPDNFNEAKYITFSMLVFCCVWVCFIPAYLSTDGKNMVVVEVFAIVASSTGLLWCIFIPKCYIILLRPELNTKQHLLGKK